MDVAIPRRFNTVAPLSAWLCRRPLQSRPVQFGFVQVTGSVTPLSRPKTIQEAAPSRQSQSVPGQLSHLSRLPLSMRSASSTTSLSRAGADSMGSDKRSLRLPGRACPRLTPNLPRAARAIDYQPSQEEPTTMLSQKPAVLECSGLWKRAATRRRYLRYQGDADTRSSPWLS